MRHSFALCLPRFSPSAFYPFDRFRVPRSAVPHPVLFYSIIDYHELIVEAAFCLRNGIESHQHQRY
jgi:hypothetical protein